MAGYQPLYVKGMTTGLVQERQDFILPDDAYPTLENAYVWREQIRRKSAYQILGRLQRNLTTLSLGNTTNAVLTYTFNTIFTSFVPPVGAGETNKEIVPGSLVISIGAPDTATFTDNGDGTFTVTGKGVALGSSVNYVTGVVVIVLTNPVVGGAAITANISYSPGLPAMGIRIREQSNSANDQTVFFDTKYAYIFNASLNVFEEFLSNAAATWSGTDSEFFWSTNYWVGDGNLKIFWVTNNSTSGNPIRYTNGVALTNWVNFTPQINAAGDVLQQALALLPFRGRMVSFAPTEGPALAGKYYSNRIRWAAIGTPFTVVSAIVTTGINANAWRDDIRGQGGFLDIPTSEDIVAVGFVRDNLVIYCERSTWQLRYTGRSIAPFQIEKVNSELGAQSLFSAVQFDTSLVGVGDKGIVECDSYKSNLIDIKIPDLVFTFQNLNEGVTRVHGIRDFVNRLAYWTYPESGPITNRIYPNKRLVYNYENDSWAIFDDSLTCLGTFQQPQSRTWLNTPIPWNQCNFSWINQPALVPDIVGGNQQGFIEYLDETTTNDISLSITAITANTTTPTVITSPNHNLNTGSVIKISQIPTGTAFDNLNNSVFSVILGDAAGLDPANKFQLMIFDASTGQFSTPQLDTPTTDYIGGGKIAVRDNFNVTSKKFNFADDGQSIQIGFLDLLMEDTKDGAITLNMFVDYNNSLATNTLPENEKEVLDNSLQPDTFFNSVISTSQSNLNTKGGNKFMQRVVCPTRGNYITLQYTFSNAQMAGLEQTKNVQIDNQIIWMRRAGRLTQI